ncbi:transcription elongation factor SPT6, partial [Trichuris trichiura]
IGGSENDSSRRVSSRYSKTPYDEYADTESAEGSGTVASKFSFVSGMDDFIQDDEDDEEVARRAARRKAMAKQHLPVSDRHMPQLIIVFSALEEARDLFGVGFQLEDVYEEDEDEEAEEGIEEDEEDYELGLEDDEGRRLKVTGRRKGVGKRSLLEQIEPAELERSFLSDFDKRVQLEDRPERFQQRSVPVSPASNEELIAEARWIYHNLFACNCLSRQIDTSRSLPISAVDKIKDVTQISRCVLSVLNFMRNQEFEVPFIAFYRKEYVQPELTIGDLWNIYYRDEKWCQLKSRKESLHALFKAVQEYQSDLILANPEDPLPSDVRPLVDDDFLAVTRAQSFEELQDLYSFFLLYYSCDVPKALEYKRRKLATNGDHSTSDIENECQQNALKQVASRNRYQLCVDAGLCPLANKLGLTPKEFAENLQVNYMRNEIAQYPQPFSEIAQEHICKQFQDVEAVTKAVKYMVALQLSREPLIRQTVRSEYTNRATISLHPTSLGRKEIDEGHPMYPYKYIKDKPIRELRRDEYLLYVQAEDNRLITVTLKMGRCGEKSYYQEVKEKKLYFHDEYSAVVQDWNRLRDEVLQICFEEMLYPSFEKEIRAKLLEEAQSFVLKRCAARMQDYLRVGPYSLLPGSSQDDDVNDKQLILGISYPMDRDQASFCVLVDKNGEIVDHIRLAHLTRQTKWSGANYAPLKGKDLERLKSFIRRRPPIVIAIAGSSLVSALSKWLQNFYLYRMALELVKDVNKIVSQLVAEDILASSVPVEVVDDELARVYAKSEVANADFSDYPITLRQAISIARRLNDPLLEFAQLCNQDEEILFLKFNALQEYVPKEELFRLITLEFINRTNEVGVDLNRCIEHPYTASVLQFVCGLGPRKAAYLLKMLRQKEGHIESRTQLVTVCKMAPKVFMNCSGFIKIDSQFNAYRTTAHDVLDSSRVHPSTYEWARKMAEDALEYEPDETDSSRLPLDEILESPERLKSLDLDAFAEELMRQGFGNMQITLYDIRAELNQRYKDLREPFRSPSREQMFYMLIKENPHTFGIGKVVLGRVMRIVYRRPQKDKITKTIPVRNAATGMWQCPFCLSGDFSELSEVWTHYDMEACPGQAVGVRLRLEAGLTGFIPVKFLSDSRVSNPGDLIQIGTTLAARIIKIDYNRMSVDLSCRTSDMEDHEHKFRPQRDPYYDHKAEEEDRRTERNLQASRQKEQYVKRVIAHPYFQNCSCKQAEGLLLEMEQGDTIIRPSSKVGPDYLTITWKVADGIYQHISVREENKEHPYSLGKSLLIDDEVYEDLDEILFRRIQPMASSARELLSYKYYREANGGDRVVLEKALLEEKKKSSAKIPYSFSASKEYPGKFILSYLPSSRVRHEYITIVPEGFRFRGRVFANVNALLKWFKEHFRDQQGWSVPLTSSWVLAWIDLQIMILEVNCHIRHPLLQRDGRPGRFRLWAVPGQTQAPQLVATPQLVSMPTLMPPTQPSMASPYATK